MSGENSKSVPKEAWYIGIFVVFFLIYMYYKACQQNCPRFLANLLAVCRKREPDNSLGAVFLDEVNGEMHLDKDFADQEPLFEANKNIRCAYEAMGKIEEGAFVEFNINRTRSNSL